MFKRLHFSQTNFIKSDFLRYTLSACLIILSAFFAACSRKDEPAPAPSPVAASPAAVARAQEWFRQQARPAAKAHTAARGNGDEQPAVDWTQAILLDEHLVAPLADTTHTFTESNKYGYRFLVVRMQEDSSYTGRIVELITPEKPATTEAAAAVALAGTEPLLDGQQPGPIADFTGSLIAYSPAYEYETGLDYKDGAVQPLRMILQTPPPDTCYDYFLVGYNNVGVMVVHDLLFSICNVSPLPLGGGWGGTSTGGGSTTTPTGPQQPAIIDTMQLKPCQAAIMRKLQGASGNRLLDIVTLFSGTDPNYNWVVRNGSNPFGRMGSTPNRFDYVNHSVTSTFDGMQMRESTDLFVACTILHEAIHAYLVAYYFNSSQGNTGSNNGVTFQTQYPAIAIAYVTGNTTIVETSHHTEMAIGGPANGWIGDIAWSLKEYGTSKGYNLDDQFYKDLAWSGLLNTAAFNALPSDTKTRIRNVVTTEQKGTNYQELPTTQVGAKACN